MAALHTAIAIVAAVVLIIRFKVDPVIALVLACLYLGLAAGVGVEGTITAVTEGFGEIMVDVGLLIGFGVLLGSLLHAMGAFSTLVNALVRVVGARRLPYAMTAALSTIFPAIYVDVQVVLASPLARSAAPRIGPRGLGNLAGAIGTGIFSGYVFVVPGLAAVSIASLIGLPLGTWLLFGIIIGPVTALVTTLLFSLLVRAGFWRPERDEVQPEDAATAPELEEEDEDAADEPARTPEDARERRLPPLGVRLLPILVPLVLIAAGAFVEPFDLVARAEAAGPAAQSAVSTLTFLGDPNMALFLGLLGAFLMARRVLREHRTSQALTSGFRTTGEILLITGVGGSLGAVIEATGLGDVLAGLFTAEAGLPVVVAVLLAWVVAALLHLAIGSVSVAAIAAAGIIGPVLGQLEVAPIAIGLAIASGAMFALHVNSNFFWMFKSLLGLTTQGTLRSLTLVTSISAVVSLPIAIAVALVA
ncbi:GntP family permease [Desertihabitans aurantiacus]|uniref:GntP family permease n=1 Tax=Desertihabitans aurantiacus TaxID=2282477 RepID=UPI000DF7341F|nr:SLC13 family permease [Desertihabitans aurantiacus]